MLSAEPHRENRDPIGAGSYGRSLDNYFRTYDPTTGRYLSRDPFGLAGGPNPYLYVLANPLGFLDPHGTFPGAHFLGADDWQEIWDAVRGAGPWDAYQAGTTLKDKAMQAARNSGLPGPHNGPQDAYRHCVWSCLITRQAGKEGAKNITQAHENANTRQGEPAKERKMDEANNAAGRECAGHKGSCEEGCLTRLKKGGLFGLGGAPLPSMSPPAQPP